MLLLLCCQQSVGLTAELDSDSEASHVETYGYLSLRSLQNQDSNRVSATALLKSRLKLDYNLFAIQLRPVLANTTALNIDETRPHLDELYWETQFSVNSFAFIGRRKVANGVAIGKNPSDFLNNTKTQDRLLNNEDRRAEIEGDDVVGWSYFGRSYNIQSLLAIPTGYSKRVRAMLQMNSSIDFLSTDISVIAYYADRPSMGMNLSTLVGENTTVYTEVAFRKGRDRQSPVLSVDNLVIAAVDDANQWIADIVIGGQYTTDTGIIMTAEYWRNNNGFSDNEYTGISNSLTSGQGDSYLTANLLKTSSLRRNSAFFRAGDIPLFDNLKGEITWIYSLDDSSNFLRGAANFDTGKTDSFRIGVDGFSGSRLTEYGSSKVNWRAFVIYKKIF